jgi:hypothetical protein
MPEPYRLTAEQVQQLRSHQAHINAARENIARLKRIGIDVSDLETDLNTAVQYRDGLIREFGPTRTTQP